MATGSFKPNATTDFLEEWKAKREKMRAKMLGDIAAATGAPIGAGNANSGGGGGRHAVPSTGTELNNNPERDGTAGSYLPSSSSSSSSSSYSLTRSASGNALRSSEEEARHPGPPAAAAPPGNPWKTDRAQCASTEPAVGNDSDKESPSPGKGKEKKSPSAPSARKGKGQIEKRKLREKRRSTGVVSIPSNESLDELDDDYAGEKDRREEEELVLANTFQNESMIADPTSGHLMDTPRPGSSRHKSSAGLPSEEDPGGYRQQRHNRHGREGGSAVQGSLEKKMEELERELTRERQENAKLLKAHQDKDDLIGKLKEEIDLLNRDLDDIEDENEQLKQENKTLLKVVGQLTR